MSKVTIAMALHNKEGALPNVLHSIKSQDTQHDYNLCLLDDMSNVDPRPLISSFFDNKNIFYHRKASGGFEKIQGIMASLIPNDTEYVIYQSSDIIWFDSKMMTKMIDCLQKDRCVAVPGLLNFEVESDLWKDPENFQQRLLNNSNNSHLYGDKKQPHYVYIGAMNKYDFNKLSEPFNNNKFICDVILRDKIKKGINFKDIDSIAIHQRHPNVVHQCGSIKDCAYECVQKKWAEEKVKFPIQMGTYNYAQGRFVK